MIIFLVGRPCSPTNGDRINWRPVGNSNHKFHFRFNSYIGGYNELHTAAWSLLKRQLLNLLNRQPSKHLFTPSSPLHHLCLSHHLLWVAVLKQLPSGYLSSVFAPLL